MQSPSLLERIKLIPRRTSFQELFLSMLVIYGALWTILEPITYFFDDFKGAENDWARYFILLIVTLLITIYRELPLNSISLTIGNTQQKVTIRFGNLFTAQGFRVIPVSKFMHEKEVFPKSLQDILIKRFTDNPKGTVKGIKDYEEKITKAIKSNKFLNATPSTRIPNQPENYYDIGSTIEIECQGDNYLLFAITETENPAFPTQSNCDLHQMLDALDGLWKYIHRNVKDQIVSVPLIGGGITGINLAPIQLLEYNLIALSDYLNRENIKVTTATIEYVLYTPGYYEKVNLKAFKNIWTNS